MGWRRASPPLPPEPSASRVPDRPYRYLALSRPVLPPGSGELAIFCFALAGASLGFLWYNAHPADVFMGDTGSLALGGALGAVAIMLKMEFQLVIIGGIFVLEALSVIAQVGWFKYSLKTRGQGERLLLMAPLHHHFEKAGWAESKIIALLGARSLLRHDRLQHTGRSADGTHRDPGSGGAVARRRSWRFGA
jgi:hypothetical protein